MTDAREDAGLAEEGLGRVRRGELRPDDLDRDFVIECDVVRDVDDAHAAACELALQAVVRPQCPLQPLKEGIRRHGLRRVPG